jgi:PAS domain S-box-containing protein
MLSIRWRIRAIPSGPACIPVGPMRPVHPVEGTSVPNLMGDRMGEAQGEALMEGRKRHPVADIRVRRLLETAPRAGLGQFSPLLEALPAAIYTTDAAGRITSYNQAAVDLWGCRPELGKSEWCGSWRLYWPDGRPMPHDQCPMAIALQERRPIKGAEAMAERPDGTRVPFLAYPSPLIDESGALLGAVNMLVDITERKRAEHVGQLLALIIESSGEAIVSRDLNGIITSWNKGAERLFGYTAEEVIGKSITILTPLDRLDEESRILERIRRGERVDPYETVRRRKDGSLIEISLAVSPVRDAEGTIIGASKIARDITQRRLADQASQQLVSIVESSDDAIVTKDLNGIITSWNQGAERLFGYSAEEALGKSITILIPADRLDEEPGVLARIRRGERIDHYETVRQRKDGSLIDISLTVSPLKDADGRIVGASKIARDITERRRVQEQQNLLLREMSHRVKNLFAVASSVVTLSARSADTPENMAKAVRARLDALTRAQELTRPGLMGAPETSSTDTTLQALVRTILSPYVDWSKEPERVLISGPDVPVAGSAVTSLALLLHEFATNAAKYGALAAASGRIRLDWSADDRELAMTWKEDGGPTVEETPHDEGFGSLLARRIVGSQFGGQLSRDWKPEGLTIQLSVPIEQLAK